MKSFRNLKIIIMLVCYYLSGCSSIPFKKVSYYPVEDIQPEVIREKFGQAIMAKFQIINSVVFKYKSYSMSALGITAIDTQNKKFTVVGLNPLGVKIFELHGEEDNVECRYIIEEFKKHGNFAKTVSDDIKRIYFDRIPSPDAIAHKEKNKIIFRKHLGKGTMEYVFAGRDCLLIGKKYYEEKQCIWSVSYYEYKMNDNKLYPSGIILNNYKYDYQLIVYLKEVIT